MGGWRTRRKLVALLYYISVMSRRESFRCEEPMSLSKVDAKKNTCIRLFDLTQVNMRLRNRQVSIASPRGPELRLGDDIFILNPSTLILKFCFIWAPSCTPFSAALLFFPCIRHWSG
ncbi:hypothetical protein LY76DRAFT_671624 [Colletotrichum caudatum]|nr:hypothetical protein LY76DRAFT_671624 [Colletotrichum caudatum]